MHLSEERIRDVFDRDTSLSEAIQRSAIEHMSRCRECWTMAVPVMASLSPRMGRPKADRFGDPRDALVSLFEAQVESAESNLHARTWARELVRLSPTEQLTRIGEVNSVVSLGVFEALLAQARAVAPRDHWLAEQIGRAALQIVDRLPDADFPKEVKGELRAAALVQIASSQRFQCDWAATKESLVDARREHSDSRSRTFAEIVSLEGVLEYDLGNLRSAQERMDTALGIYTSLQDERGVVFAHLQLSDLYVFEPEKKVFHAKLALATNRGRWTRLELFGRLLHTEGLVFLQRIPEAMLIHNDSLPLFDTADDIDALKVRYVEAILLDAKQDARLADKAFKDCIDVATEMDLFKFALVVRCYYYSSLYRRRLWVRCLEAAKDTVKFMENHPRAHAQLKTVWDNLIVATEKQIVTDFHIDRLNEYLVLHWGKAADAGVSFHTGTASGTASSAGLAREPRHGRGSEVA